MTKRLGIGNVVLASLFAMGAAGTAQAADTAATKVDGKDKAFVMEAAKGGLAEVELGQLAKERALSDEVKQFGQHMVDDHTQANEKLKGVATQKGITVPAEPDAKSKALKDKLSKLSGAAFDKQYMREMVKDHEKDVALFQKEAKGGKDTDLASWAQTTLPTLQDHLKMAHETEDKLKKNQTAARGTSN